VKWVVFIRPRAEEDIFEARNWYDQQQANLGSRFLHEVSRAIKVLETDATRFPIYYKGFRRILLPRFPYKLFYLIEGNRAIIFRVLHAKRNHRYRLPPNLDI